MSLWEDFKKFAFQGNIVDLAIAVVIGAAFNEIVTSLVDNIIMPLIGVLMKGVNFEGLMWQVGAAEVTYGMFIQSVLNFFLIAAALFFIIRFILRKKQEEEEEPEVDPKEELLVEIRDLLKEQQMKG
ncbi:MAG TPA: large conductance mechanosensitive channel protein MscL [Pseudogracilibacillus sp.]|nr:large conductance mechanosensitive channel protein MscL [Pseudogracilibacillus sp.]